VNYLEATRLLRGLDPSAPGDTLLLATSATAEGVVHFLRACAARRQRHLTIRTLSFGTLQQFLFTQPAESTRELFLLMPWDLVPAADWRTGFPAETFSLAAALAEAEQRIARLAHRRTACFAYLPAPLPPLFADDREVARLAHALPALLQPLEALILPADFFSLTAFFATGAMASGQQMPLLAEALDRLLHAPPAGQGKVLATDLDNVMWAGLAAEEGPHGVLANPDGAGFPHFLYQSYLQTLKRNGILLVAVSRNDDAVARAPLQQGDMVLQESDFVAIAASYDAKSAHIRAIAQQLNLGLDAFVFVDDNPIELAEVGKALPQVHCLRFPERAEALPELLHALARHFRRTQITQEDVQRTALYQRRLATLPPPEVGGADLTAFLRSLHMVLEIADRTHGEQTRALQLINKTNQFNLNGRRFEPEDLAQILSSGGRLYVASLADSMGSHGEITACLVTSAGEVLAWVLSCRVFQRRVEQAFLVWLAERLPELHAFHFCATEKNLPLQQFMAESAAFVPRADGILDFDREVFLGRYQDAVSLFETKTA
jgi:FkbH-like protein